MDFAVHGARTSAALALVVMTVVAVALVLPTASVAAPSITNVQVNQTFSGPFPTNKQNEPSLAQNPKNPSNLISGSNDEIGEPACSNTTPSSCPFVTGVQSSGFYDSFNGGKTWPCQGLIDLSAFHEYSFGDPAQAFDSKGNAYYGTLAFPSPPTTEELATGLQSDFFVAKSTDGGCHYTSAARVSGSSPAIFDDKDAITADANPSSPFHDNVYAAWTKFTTGGDQIVFSRSTDGRATFSNPLAISPDYNNNHVGGRQGAAVKVGPDGTVYVVWLDTVNKQAVERLSISHNGGKTFPMQNITVATVTDDFVSPVPGSSFRQDARSFPSFSIAPDGTLYVALGNRTGDPTNGHAVVLVTKSTNGGVESHKVVPIRLPQSLTKSYRPSHWHTQVASRPLAKRGGLIDRWAGFASLPAHPSGRLWLSPELAPERARHFPQADRQTREDQDQSE